MKKIKLISLLVIITNLSSCNSNDITVNDNLIFKDNNGNQIALSDLEGVTGTYNWEIIDDKTVSSEAIQLHQEARQHGSKGEFILAIEKLKKATTLAPDWAYPVYDLAYTNLQP